MVAHRGAQPTGRVAGQQSDEVAGLDCDLPDETGHQDGQVGLRAAAGGARPHLDAGVDHDEQLLLALGHVAAHQHRAGAGRGLPIDVAHVVAALVVTEVVELHRPALVDGPVLAGEQAAHPQAGREAETSLHGPQPGCGLVGGRAVARLGGAT